MYKINRFNGSAEYNLKEGAVLTIGNFDGVHIGHTKLINTLTKTAKAAKIPCVVYTFYPHPFNILYPHKNHVRLCSIQTTEHLLYKMGVENIIVEPFTLSFSKLSAEEFIQKHIITPINPTVIIVGYNFRFGLKGEGCVKLLSKLQTKYNFKLHVIPPIKKQGVIVSSSLIKKSILLGKWNIIPSILGRYFFIKCEVIKGEGRGSGLGFPTINLKIDKNILLPINGVYIARVRHKNQYFEAVINIGTNPTFLNKCEKKVEVHIMDTNKKWIHKQCEVEFLYYLRAEKQFLNSQQLITQIKKDIIQAKKYFSK